MDILHAIILGIIEGLTEFLPVSSTGHLVLASDVLRIEQTEFVKSFEIAIQSGAILAVLALYWKKLFLDLKILKRVMVSFVPTAIIGIILYRTFKDVLLGNETIVVVSLVVVGAIIILFEVLVGDRRSSGSDISDMSYKKCFLVGVCQAVSIIPGVSRAGATIIGGMALGFKRETIVRFSFLLAIPTMISATGYDLVQSSPSFTADEFGILAVGFAVSFIVAILAIKVFLKFVQSNNLVSFGAYRIAIGIVFFLVMGI